MIFVGHISGSSALYHFDPQEGLHTVEPNRSHHSIKYRQIITSRDYHKYSCSPKQYISAMPSQPQSLTCCADWDFVCPSTLKVAILNRNKKAFGIFFIFINFYLSCYCLIFCFYFYQFPLFLFLKPQLTHAIAVKCDISMYYIDVEVSKT